MSTRPRSSATRARVASMPSMTGICTSISTTSGRSARACSSAVGAGGGLADHLEVGLDGEHHPEAGAHEVLVVDDEHAQRRVGAQARSASSGTRTRTR